MFQCYTSAQCGTLRQGSHTSSNASDALKPGTTGAESFAYDI